MRIWARQWDASLTFHRGPGLPWCALSEEGCWWHGCSWRTLLRVPRWQFVTWGCHPPWEITQEGSHPWNPPEKPEAGTQESMARWGPTVEWEARVGGHTEHSGMEGPQRPSLSPHTHLHSHPSSVLTSPPDICHSLNQEWWYLPGCGGHSLTVLGKESNPV